MTTTEGGEGMKSQQEILARLDYLSYENHFKDESTYEQTIRRVEIRTLIWVLEGE